MKLILFILCSIHVGIAVADEAVRAIVLQSNEKEHIGFTLFHPYFAASEGDCVFVIAPKDSDLYDSFEVVTLLEIKDRGEHQWLRKGDEVIISFNGVEVLKMYEDGTLAQMPSDVDLGNWFPVPVGQ